MTPEQWKSVSDDDIIEDKIYLLLYYRLSDDGDRICDVGLYYYGWVERRCGNSHEPYLAWWNPDGDKIDNNEVPEIGNYVRNATHYAEINFPDGINIQCSDTTNYPVMLATRKAEGSYE